MKPGTFIDTILSFETDPGFAGRAGFILHHLADAKPKKVLEAGCGRGFYVGIVSQLESTHEMVGIDLNPTYVKRASSRATAKTKLHKGSIYNIPYPDNYFDYVICSEVLEHLEDDHAAIVELKRVLKPKGYLAISVPHAHYPFLWDPINWVLTQVFHTHVPKHIWWLAGIWADHVRLYTRKQLQDVVKKAGFTIRKEQDFVRWCWPFSHFWLYAIGKNIVELMPGNPFDRFSTSQDRPLARALSKFVSLPSRVFDKRVPVRESVILGLIAQK